MKQNVLKVEQTTILGLPKSQRKLLPSRERQLPNPLTCKVRVINAAVHIVKELSIIFVTTELRESADNFPAETLGCPLPPITSPFNTPIPTHSCFLFVAVHSTDE
jgi:hypothetical protein